MKLKAISALVLFGLSASTVYAGIEEHSPRANPLHRYQLGGALVTDPPTQIETYNILDMGISWNLGDECGEFDPQISISNQLNGITEGFENMMDNIISAATGAVASLPALAIQRADPGLYDLLQQGILQGKVDFEYAKLSCEDMANVMMGNQDFPFENYKLAIKTTNWSKEISASGGDAVAAKNEMDDRDHGDEGIDWICDQKQGGSGQEPITALSDVVLVGYNILFDRADECDTSGIPNADGDGTAIYKYWTSPTLAAAWLVEVIGDTEVRLCKGCDRQKGKPGRGLTEKYVRDQEVIASNLEDLVTGITTMTFQNLNIVSAPPALEIDQAVILAIRGKAPELQGDIIANLASEIAMTKIFEQARLQVQMLRTGVREPNVSAVAEVRAVVAGAVNDMLSELETLQRETEIQHTAAKKTIFTILGYEEMRVQGAEGPRNQRPSGVNATGTPR
jgi:integrating conjugative element protein (TIGR03755 family)